MKIAPFSLLRFRVSNPRFTALALGAIAACTPLSSALAQTTGFNQTGTGPFNYNDTANWVGSSINGIWDSTLSIPVNQVVYFNADTPLSTGIDIEYAGSGNLTFTGSGGARTITLGGNITVNPSSNRTINFGSNTASQVLNVDLGGETRIFNVSTSRTLGFVNAISNGGITINGGTVNFSGINTYSGQTTVNTGVLNMNGSVGSSANSDIVVNAGSSGATSVAFNSNSSGNSGVTRAKSVTLRGTGASGLGTASLIVTGNSGSNSNDTITNALSAEGGLGLVTVTPNASRNARLSIGSLNIADGSTVLFRGTNLGLNASGSQTAGSANIVFTGTTPTLSGGNGAAGTTTMGIISGAYGGTTASSNGDGLVTYDTANGVRLLNTTTEYASSIVDGQTQLTNVRLVGATGLALTNTVSTPTTIGSLSLIVPTTTSGNAGVTVTGAGTLTIDSGAIFASQTITGGTGIPAASDAMTINVPTLSFNSQEAVIIVALTNAQSGASNITNAPLQIDSAITNANGLTKSGLGYLRLGGTTANTFSGTTIVNSGNLGLAKTSGVDALGGDLLVNGGAVYWVGSNQIKDNANITLNGGSVNFRPSNNTGSSTNETFNNLTMTGGGFSTGASSAGANTVALNNAYITGGTVTMSQNNKLVTTGVFEISNGAVLSIGRARSTSSIADTSLTLGGGLNVANTASGAYTPITLTSGTSATNFGGRIILNSNLTFTGNGTNTNTTTIDTTADAGPQGTLALNGIRTFNIGNGAAAVDLTIVAPLVSSTTAGGLIKAGAGVLALNGANTYTDTTTVTAGTLLINGSSVSATTVTGGVLGGTGAITNSVSIGNAGTIASGNSPGVISTGDFSLTGAGSTIAMEIAGMGAGQYDQINVTGAVNLNDNGVISLSLLSYVPQPSDVFFLVLNDGADAINGTLFNLAQGGTFSAGGYTWQVSYVGNSTTGIFTGGNDLALQIIPEPGTWALVAGGLTIVTLFRRRRAR